MLLCCFVFHNTFCLDPQFAVFKNFKDRLLSSTISGSVFSSLVVKVFDVVEASVQSEYCCCFAVQESIVWKYYKSIQRMWHHFRLSLEFYIDRTPLFCFKRCKMMFPVFRWIFASIKKRQGGAACWQTMCFHFLPKIPSRAGDVMWSQSCQSWCIAPF